MSLAIPRYFSAHTLKGIRQAVKLNAFNLRGGSQQIRRAFFPGENSGLRFVAVSRKESVKRGYAA